MNENTAHIEPYFFVQNVHNSGMNKQTDVTFLKSNQKYHP